MSFPVTTRGPQTAADWTAANPILDQFEVGIEINPATGAYERAKLGDGRTAWADLAYWNPSGGPKVYRALLTQTGTDAPVATVLENTLGGTVVWTRSDAGQYDATLSGAFTADKTGSNSGFVAGSADFLGAFGFSCTSANVMRLVTTFPNDFTLPQDDVLSATYVEILVYP